MKRYDEHEAGRSEGDPGGGRVLDRLIEARILSMQQVLIHAKRIADEDEAEQAGIDAKKEVA